MVAQATEDVDEAPDDGGQTVVRTMRFEVVFPGWRRTDLADFRQKFWDAEGDLRRAANLAMSALYQLKLGTIPWPEAEAKKGVDKGKVRKVPLRTLCYQALSGGWQPFGHPLYTPGGGHERVSSNALLDLAGYLFVRIRDDWPAVQMGKKSLPTWRSVPIGSPYVDVDKETGSISFALWAGRAGRVTVRPRKLDGRGWSDLRRAVKFGTCRLTWYQPVGRKGRWMLSVSAQFEKRAPDPAQKPLVAAVRLGMLTTCTLAYCEPGKSSVGRADSVDLPGSTWRSVRRIERERTERGEWNRRDRGQREGRGRERKLRATQGLSDTVARVTDTAVRQVAAAVVATAVRRGATVLALPDLQAWSVAQEMDRTRDLPEEGRAAHRRWYLRWHQGALRQRIEQAAQLRGLTVVTVDVVDSSKTCSACGRVDEALRSERRWECPCGCKLSVECNTARVLAKRAADRIAQGQAGR